MHYIRNRDSFGPRQKPSENISLPPLIYVVFLLTLSPKDLSVVSPTAPISICSNYCFFGADNSMNLFPGIATHPLPQCPPYPPVHHGDDTITVIAFRNGPGHGHLSSSTRTSLRVRSHGAGLITLIAPGPGPEHNTTSSYTRQSLPAHSTW